jgi:hypothetical protein
LAIDADNTVPPEISVPKQNTAGLLTGTYSPESTAVTVDKEKKRKKRSTTSASCSLMTGHRV